MFVYIKRTVQYMNAHSAVGIDLVRCPPGKRRCHVISFEGHRVSFWHYDMKDRLFQAMKNAVRTLDRRLRNSHPHAHPIMWGDTLKSALLRYACLGLSRPVFLNLLTYSSSNQWLG